jgi:hypothetical protein
MNGVEGRAVKFAPSTNPAVVLTCYDLSARYTYMCVSCFDDDASRGGWNGPQGTISHPQWLINPPFPPLSSRRKMQSLCGYVRIAATLVKCRAVLQVRGKLLSVPLSRHSLRTWK